MVGRAHGRPRDRQARREEVRRSSPASTSAPRSRSSPTACAATSPRRWSAASRSTTGRSPQLYAIGIKELWEVPADRIARGHGDPHDGLSRSGWRSSAAGSSTRMPDGRLVGRFRHRARLQGSDVRSARGVSSTSSGIRFVVGPAGRRADGALRRQGAAGGRLAHHPARLRRRCADRRRRRRVPELDAPQGHPPGHADRHARRRGGVRGGRATTMPRRRGCAATRRHRLRATSAASCIRCATCTRASATGCSPAWCTRACRW